MKNICVVLLSTYLLTACSIFEQKIVTETIEVKVPVVSSPAPPIIPRPKLVIHEMSDSEKENPGILAKYYKATVTQLLDYSKELESALNEYKIISEELENQNLTE